MDYEELYEKETGEEACYEYNDRLNPYSPKYVDLLIDRLEKAELSSQ